MSDDPEFYSAPAAAFAARFFNELGKKSEGAADGSAVEVELKSELATKMSTDVSGTLPSSLRRETIQLA